MSSVVKQSQDAIPYQYDNLALNSIRLIKLKPGRRDEPIECDLMTARMEDKIYYEAISYVWGDVKDMREITCSSRPLRITSSLYNALGDIRDPHATRVLWTDAVCINQVNLKERAQQVQIMGVAGSQGCGSSKEAALAKNPYLCWGETEIEWKPLVHLLELIGSQRIAVGDLWHKVGYEWNLWLVHLAFKPSDTEFIKLVQLLHAARGHAATDSRDHVFAFLGHPGNLLGGIPLLTAEYEVPSSEVFRDVAIKMLQYMGNLDILSYVNHDEYIEQKDHRPAWVPDWDRLPCTLDGFKVRVFPFLESKLFKDKTIAVSSDVIRIEENNTVLVAKGRLINKVAWQSEAIIYTMISPGLWLDSKQIHPLEKAWRDLKSHYLAQGYKGDMLKLFSLMLVSGHAKKEEVERRGSAHSANFDAEHAKHTPIEESNDFFDGVPLV